MRAAVKALRRWIPAMAAALLGWAWTPACGQEAQVLSLSLEEGVRMALEHNESVKMVRTDLDKARQQVREVGADGLPRFDVSLNYNRNWLLPTFVFGGRRFKSGTDNIITSTLSMRQALYTGGRVRAAREGARFFVDYSTEIKRAAEQQLRQEVEEGFYAVLLARSLLEVGWLGLERARSNLDQVQALRRAGRASDYDRLRAEVQVATLESDSLRAQNALEVANMSFKDLIGLELDRSVEISGAFRDSTQLDLDGLERLLQLGNERRPEMRQLERLIDAQESNVEVERAGSRPTVDLVANGQLQFQRDDEDFDQVDNFDNWSKSWSTALSVQIPLFDGQRTGARVTQARLDLQRLQTQKEQLERTIHLEIRQAWMDIREARAQLRSRRSTVGQAERGLEVAELRYGTGAGTQLEILDAQLTLLQARTDFATARRDQALALVRLERAVGVLGEEEGR